MVRWLVLLAAVVAVVQAQISEQQGDSVLDKGLGLSTFDKYVKMVADFDRPITKTAPWPARPPQTSKTLKMLAETEKLISVAEEESERKKRQNLPQQRVDELLRQEDPRTNEINGGFGDEEEEPLTDLCAGIRCSAGRGCIITEQGTAGCTCVDKCETETDPRRRVCSNHNETWMSDCDLHRQRCLCEEDLPGCQEDKYEHLQIDYFGQCQQLPTCEVEELADFPRRMREWLFAVMRDMASRNLLARQYKKMEKEAEMDASHRWTNAVVWKWCDLDGYPKDRVVSRHELFPIRAPLLTLEHCISPFLDSCDPDDDHRVTLKEWATCLDLNDAHVESMQDLCEDIRDSASIEA